MENVTIRKGYIVRIDIIDYVVVVDFFDAALSSLIFDLMVAGCTVTVEKF